MSVEGTLAVLRETAPPRTTIADVRDRFSRYLYLPESAALDAVIAALIANRMNEGDPVWLIVVAGSSRGKTELVMALDGLAEVRVTGKLTEAALLSGTSKKDRDANAKGGLLREIGERGTLVVKDLGAILAMHRDSRSEVLQALRDVYDGRYVRDVGVDGGKRLEWEGRLGLIGAATTALDSHHAVLSALGERWLTVRLPEAGEEEMAQRALRNRDTRGMRKSLREVVAAFLDGLEPPQLLELSEEDEQLLVALSALVCRARSPVDRDSYSREIVLVHDSEGPARIARQLHKLFCALLNMGIEGDEARIIASKVALDSIPSPRREILMHLLENGEQKTAQIATALDLPTRTAERSCEELAAHGVFQRGKAGEADNAANVWSASPVVEGWWSRIQGSPEMSVDGGSNYLNSTYDDFSGELFSSPAQPPSLTGFCSSEDAA